MHVPPPNDPLGTILNDCYLVEHILGQGGMGIVYKALDLQNNLPVALKALRPDKSTANPEILQRFIREGEILRELDHPNIVRLLDAFEQDGVHFLVMDYVAGGDLSNLIEAGDLPDIPTVLSFAIDIADALTRAHRLNILHRDIKPANVLLESNGTIRLTDFGIASLNTDTRLTEDGTILGTIAYLPPEACMGLELDERADAWSFGVLLYELLLGEPPFIADQPIAVMQAILHQELPDVQALRPEIPDALADLLYRMLVKDRDGRIRSVRLVGAELEMLLKGKQPAVNIRDDGSLLESLSEGTSVFDTPTPDIEPANVRLPAQSTRFVGRKQELAEIERLLNEPDVRLLTLLGAGGMGKTRLAIEAARAQAQKFKDGVVFVDLAPLKDKKQLPRAIAEALLLAFDHESGYEEQLIGFLHGKEILLILDNFEHLVSSAPFLVDLLNNTSTVRMLVTSRKRLDLATEYIFEIRGLSLPEEGFLGDLEEIEAIELFLLHARRIYMNFQVTEAEKAQIARICRQVEGMPLGIQLAASWIRTILIGEIAEELENDLDFLAREQHDIPARQRSMRAVFDYSWKLLSADQREAFKNISIFRGGFSRDAARDVAGTSIRVLSSLVDQSLIHRTPSGRFSVHELMRQFGGEKLEASKDEKIALNDRHGDYYCLALQDLDQALSSEKMLSAVAEIDLESSNIDTAWAYAIANHRVESLLNAINGYGNYFDASGRWYEGILLFRDNAGFLENKAKGPPVSPGEIRLRIWLAAWQVNLDINGRGGNVDPHNAYNTLLAPAYEWLQHPVLANQDCHAEEAYLRLQLSRIMKRLPGRREEAQHHTEVSLELYQMLSKPRGISDALYEYHFFAIDDGDYDLAGKRLEESLNWLPRPTDPRRVNRLLNARGFLARQKNQFNEAFDFFEQAAQLARSSGYWGGIYYSRYMGIMLSWELGQFEKAMDYSHEALDIVRKQNNHHRLFVCMALIAWTMTNTGDFAKAGEQHQEIHRIQQIKKAAVFSIMPAVGSQPLVDLHLGHYDQVMLSPLRAHGGIESKGWVHLLRNQANEAFEKVLSFSDELDPSDYRNKPILDAVLAMALFRMGRKQESLQRLTEGLQTSLDKHNILALFRLLPVAAWVLSDTEDARQKSYALEVWTLSMAQPFVGHSKLFAELIGTPMQKMAEDLPEEAVSSAIERGNRHEIWSACREVLSRLNALE